MEGKLARDFYERWGFRYSVRELLLGGLYLTLIAACFYLLSAPFRYWMFSIDIKFGFTNPLAVTSMTFRNQFIGGLLSILIWGVPTKFVFLAVLQYRLGWVFMWALLIIGLIFAQYNIQVLAPMLLNLNNPFPTSIFAVGRGFPFVRTKNKTTPWISLNRIYFKDSMEPPSFYTKDLNKGQLILQPDQKSSGAQPWVISEVYDPAKTVYAQTVSAVAQKFIGGLDNEAWQVGGQGSDGNGPRMGLRNGEKLNNKLFAFARDRKIGIAGIYMVFGSHKDARANAFVSGAGNNSVIGLYDTLFLGGHQSDAEDDPESDFSERLASGGSLVQLASETIQAVDEEEPEERRAPRNSADTQAMSDDEIVAILAHELAHPALMHLEQGMVMQAFTSFVTFGTMGFMAHSPLAAMALSLSAPVLHVGACAYEHFVGPPVEGIMKFFSDALTRHNEYQADEYAALISEKYGTALQTSLAKLSVNSNQDPDVPTFYEALHHDHPTFAKRWAHIENVKKKAYGKQTSKP